MYLVHQRLNGKDVPQTLPLELVPPSVRDLSALSDFAKIQVMQLPARPRISPSNSLLGISSISSPLAKPLLVPKEVVLNPHDLQRQEQLLAKINDKKSQIATLKESIEVIEKENTRIEVDIQTFKTQAFTSQQSISKLVRDQRMMTAESSFTPQTQSLTSFELDQYQKLETELKHLLNRNKDQLSQVALIKSNIARAKHSKQQPAISTSTVANKAAALLAARMAALGIAPAPLSTAQVSTTTPTTFSLEDELSSIDLEARNARIELDRFSARLSLFSSQLSIAKSISTDTEVAVWDASVSDQVRYEQGLLKSKQASEILKDLRRLCPDLPSGLNKPIPSHPTVPSSSPHSAVFQSPTPTIKPNVAMHANNLGSDAEMALQAAKERVARLTAASSPKPSISPQISISSRSIVSVSPLHQAPYSPFNNIPALVQTDFPMLQETLFAGPAPMTSQSPCIKQTFMPGEAFSSDPDGSATSKNSNPPNIPEVSIYSPTPSGANYNPFVKNQASNEASYLTQKQIDTAAVNLTPKREIDILNKKADYFLAEGNKVSKIIIDTKSPMPPGNVKQSKPPSPTKPASLACIRLVSKSPTIMAMNSPIHYSIPPPPPPPPQLISPPKRLSRPPVAPNSIFETLKTGMEDHLTSALASHRRNMGNLTETESGEESGWDSASIASPVRADNGNFSSTQSNYVFNQPIIHISPKLEFKDNEKVGTGTKISNEYLDHSLEHQKSTKQFVNVFSSSFGNFLFTKALFDTSVESSYMYQAVAVFEFLGTASGDLTLYQGDIVNVVSEDGEWVVAKKLSGESGLVPIAFLQRKAPQILTSISTESAEVIYPFIASHDDELSVEVGTIVEIIEIVDGDWWRVKSSLGLGLVPCTFMKHIDNIFSPAPYSNDVHFLNTPIITEAPELDIEDDLVSDESFKRKESILEFISTERSYVSDLRVMIDVLIR